MNKNMTVIEWLMQTLEQNNMIDLDWGESDKYYTIIEQAKEMYKKEMIDACHKMQIINDVDYCGNVTFIFSPEDYYNETFGGAGEPGR